MEAHINIVQYGIAIYLFGRLALYGIHATRNIFQHILTHEMNDYLDKFIRLVWSFILLIFLCQFHHFSFSWL